MANITVSSTIDTFLKTSTLSAAQSAINVVGLNSAGKVPDSNLYGQTYSTILHIPNGSDVFGVTTSPLSCSVIRIQDPIDFYNQVMIGTKVENLYITIYNYDTVDMSPDSSAVFSLKNVTINCTGPLGLYIDLPTVYFPSLTALTAGTSTDMIEINSVPATCKSYYFSSLSTDSTWVDSIIVQISNQTSVSGGTLNLSNYHASPTSASQSARASLTARGWTVLTF
jgi:hypothetical protein